MDQAYHELDIRLYYQFLMNVLIFYIVVRV